jgi:hypothetical protein
MAGKLTITGIHAVSAEEPCHLVEILVTGLEKKFDVGEVTQEVVGQPRSNWQAPYDERVLEKTADTVRYAFFFHYLDLEKPLITPLGAIPLPEPTVMATHLKEIEYEAP